MNRILKISVCQTILICVTSFNSRERRNYKRALHDDNENSQIHYESITMSRLQESVIHGTMLWNLWTYEACTKAYFYRWVAYWIVYWLLKCAKLWRHVDEEPFRRLRMAYDSINIEYDNSKAYIVKSRLYAASERSPKCGIASILNILWKAMKTQCA